MALRPRITPGVPVRYTSSVPKNDETIPSIPDAVCAKKVETKNPSEDYSLGSKNDEPYDADRPRLRDTPKPSMLKSPLPINSIEVGSGITPGGG